MKKCGAKTTKGGTCQLVAGFGTDHVGTGRCRVHGGKSKGAAKGNKFSLKHGIYSRLFTDDELDEAKSMQGSVENELAIARLQLFRLLQTQNKHGDEPLIDKVEESTIVQEGKKSNTLERMERSARECGEYYDPDGDEDLIQEQESEVFSRKRIYQRRDFQNEYVRLTALIARLEQQILHAKKTKAEIKIIEVTGNKSEDADDKLTDTELDKEIQELISGFEI